MKFVRCPACQTVFRVRPEQLSARHGEVRCGHCFNPFNALDHLLATPESQAQPQTDVPLTPATPPHTPVCDEAPAITVPSDRHDPTPCNDTPAAAANEFHDPELDFEIPEVWRSPREQLKIEANRPHTSLADDAPPSEADSAFPQAPTPELAATSLASESADFSASFAASLATAGAGRIEPSETAAPNETAPVAPDTESVVDDSDDAGSEEPPPPATDDEEDLPVRWRPVADPTPAEAHLDARYGPKPGAAPAGHRWLWSLGVGVMLGTLAVQSAYLFRLEITRSMPMLRPLYLAACAQFGCTVPLPRDAELISITTSDLQSDPYTPGNYVLDATVRNRAAYPQEWPYLELTLTDAQDRPLVRRVLDPAEWAHAETAKLRAGFPAGREQAVELRFEAPSLRAAGYRLYVFYP